MNSPPGPDYDALLAAEIAREPALADDSATPEPRSSRHPLYRRLINRASRYGHRALVRVRGQRTERWWLPCRDFDIVPAAAADAPRVMDIGVHLHVYFLDLLPELLGCLEHFPENTAVYATTDSERKATAIEALLARHPRVDTQELSVAPNRGRDIGPWVTTMAEFNDRHEAWCHLHTKKSLHAPATGADWRKFLLGSMAGSEQKVHDVLAYFHAHPRSGLIVPAFHSVAVKEDFVPFDDRAQAAAFYRRLGLSCPVPRRPFFAAGTMCWYRSDALAPLFRAGLASEDFEAEAGQVTGTLMHVIERALPDIAAHRGYSLAVSLPA